ERYFQASERIIIWPEDDVKMVQAIRKIKTSGETAEARSLLLEASTELTRRGANLQLVACPEFPMIQTSHDPSAAMIDTLDVLAEAVAQFALEARGP
ncbi:MAG TPA: aspartate racemase, partial [Rhodobacteraceae bacterium]|nr:aspartate racemase [Paracoccaceae bacterium]